MLILNMNDLASTLWTVLLLSAAFLGLFLFLYRRRIISIFDPLIMLAMAQTAQCVIAPTFIHSNFLLLQFFASQAALVFGYLLIPAPRMITGEGKMIWTARDVLIAEWTIAILFVLLIAANLWLGIAAGFPLFTDNPVDAKFTLYTGGLGLVRRINSAAGMFVPAGALLLAAKGKHKAFFGVLFAACLPIAAVNGSKGPLIIFLQLIGYVLYRRDLVLEKVRKKLWLLSLVLVVTSIFLGVFVLYIISNDWQLAAQGLLERLLHNGDAVVFYYDPRVLPHMASLGPIDFLNTIFIPILGGFHLVAYRADLGHQMILDYMNYSPLADDISGPNTNFFVVGHVYFGSFFGVVYCAAVGYFVAWTRNLFLRARKVSPLRLTWFLALAVSVYNLPTEVDLFTSPLFDMAWMVLIAVMATHFLLFVLEQHRREYPPSQVYQI